MTYNNSHHIKPKVSVGMPIRNGGELLQRALESVLNQTFTDIEIIISDNGSTDGSTELLKSYAKLDNRIRYFFQDPQLSVLANFDFVRQEARGEYFFWAAHDDFRSSDFISVLLNAIENDRNSVLAFCDVVLIDSNSKISSCPNPDFHTEGLSIYKRIKKESAIHCYHIYGLWRLSDLMKIPLPDCAFGPDKAFLLSASIIGPFLYVPGPTFFYYFDDDKKYIDESYRYKQLFDLLLSIFHNCNATGNIFLGIYAVNNYGKSLFKQTFVRLLKQRIGQGNYTKIISAKNSISRR